MIKLNKYPFQILIFLYLVVLYGCQQKKQELPNIIIIFTDDQGYADLGYYGAEGFQTPNIDQLADDGIRFTDFYVSEAVCSASRASLLTGCYAQRVNIRGALSAISFTGLNPDETTIASMLKQKGYATGIFGKWHLGHQREFLPFNFGFDEYLGLPYSNDMWPVDFDGTNVSEGYRGLYPDLCLIDDSVCVKEILNLKDQEALTTFYTNRAVDFINRNKDNPFFLYLPYSMVHVPLAVSDKYKGKSEQGLYGDAMMEIDWSVGEVVKALEKNGLEKNTLIIYTSDNGPWLSFGNHGGSAGLLREGKGTAWEGGVRVPCIMKWPGKIKPNVVSEEFVTTMDILPTIAAVINSELPVNQIDGINILPFLTGEVQNSPRDEFYYYYEGKLCAVRKDSWKLVLPHSYRSYQNVEPGKDGLPGPYSKGQSGLELYDLKNDISEKENVADQYPEIVEDLLKIADEARSKLGDDILKIEGLEVRPCGKVGGVDSVFNLATGKDILLKNPPDKKYTGNGEKTLIDGVLGSYDFLDGQWTGFRDQDLNLIIDMGKATPVSQISARFLLNQTSWIFLPGEFEILVSKDGRKFELIFRKSYENDLKDLGINIKQIGLNTDVEARFISVRAKGIGNCPEWHPGKNEKGWMFLDEIIVK